ncbi:MAG: serine/threonine protein kinase [Methylococcales bacterium]|nr:serine/threonine protein kinase [Methylococcales bacterium]
MNTYLNFNEYKLKYLASGGYAKLYIAIPKKTGRPCLCVKFLHPDFIQSSVHVIRFQKELFLLKAIDHKGLPQLIHNGLSDIKPYIAYQYIAAGTVLNLLKESAKPSRDSSKKLFNPVTQLFKNLYTPSKIPYKKHYLNTQLAINIMVQLLEILDYLHNLPKPIVHSDISPENLLLDYQNKLYLIDFGCAKTFETNDTERNNWIGKPSYLSPEQAQGLNWDYRSDLYQAGIIFYELLSHHKKNSGLNEQDARIIAATPPSLILSNIPPVFHDFIKKLLHTDLNQRWQSAKECLIELKKASNS